ncbi:hypothetical protein ASPZODRAFT_152037 [Penicilliopsis zonata CBS 506.65]|uniref:Mediator complex subunit 27 n=1 Tax=Penicilliopsis zonata CBS 506.65 TaxID=1073090 RepID=A0A1L9SH36_9EURO|nr:hypothetical protein ASPZODRAFT_152037 [Penicilliopsis zonata CBS 506.65]OJJ46570.1 hypothetical protein ASPZODRAFT_152037 [Penicilliopsis zonata CBS 506.65]
MLKVEDHDSTNPQANIVNWDSEMQLVSSLNKLQELEKRIHQLRTLLPDRLLLPLRPITQPEAAKQMPRSPQVLLQELKESARSGVAEVGTFQAMWQSPEMAAVWARVDERIRDNGGELLQPSGVWERDYDVLLEGLVGSEREERQHREQAEREAANSKAQAAEGDWRSVVAAFATRGVPGVHVLSSSTEERIVTIVLVRAGITFQAQNVCSLDNSGAPEWLVSIKTAPGTTRTKLETAVCDCLNQRGRKWDLSYLLDMISSYSTIKQTPCKKCQQMTDRTAQLPTIRRYQNGNWEAYHESC